MGFQLDPPMKTLPLWFRLLVGAIIAGFGVYAWYMVRGGAGLMFGGILLVIAILVTLWKEPDGDG